MTSLLVFVVPHQSGGQNSGMNHKVICSVGGGDNGLIRVGWYGLQESGIHPWVCIASGIFWRYGHQGNLVDTCFHNTDASALHIWP